MMADFKHDPDIGQTSADLQLHNCGGWLAGGEFVLEMLFRRSLRLWADMADCTLGQQL